MAAFGCVVLVTACGPVSLVELDVSGRPIMYGSPDRSEAHQAVVAISIGSYALCSGTLITRDVVLTAAHCLDEDVSQYKVVFGPTMTSNPQRRVAEIEPHGAFDFLDEYSFNDIGLLRLETDAPEDIQPIPILPHSWAVTQDDIGETIEFVGYGQTETGSSGTKLHVDGTIEWVCTDPIGCVVDYGQPADQSLPAVPNSICFRMDPDGPCSGDSGGATLIQRAGREYVAGAIIYGHEGCRYFGCSTKVDEYEEPFIADFTGGRLADECESSRDCLSGYCVDGICCQTSCDQPCRACNLVGKEGSCVTVPTGSACSDDNVCNGEEECLMGDCISSDPPDCDDANACTEDSCDPQAGCQNQPLDDGSSCGDCQVCQDGACVADGDCSQDDGNGGGCASAGGGSGWAFLFGLLLLFSRRRIAE